MKGLSAFAALSCALVLPLACLAQETPPPWAYPVNPPDFRPDPDDGAPRRVPGSNVALTLAQIGDRFSASIWHPQDHPAPPAIVASGRKPDVFACGFCHRADGPGGPENANLTGLSAGYMKRQLADFKSGARKSSVMNRAPMQLKMQLAAAITDEEIDQAVAYFASIKPRSIVKVVEADEVPRSRVYAWHMAAAPGNEREPIGERIIEIPDELQHFVSRDARATFTAYVPKGAIARGRALAGGQDPRVSACGSCHGQDLKGAGIIPGIAGRSPSYIVRQLWDFKNGARAGGMSAMMKPAAAQLGLADMSALAAYAGSLAP